MKNVETCPLKSLFALKYNKKKQKRNVKFIESDEKISFSPIDTYYFNAELSNGSQSDMVTFLNLPVVVREFIINFLNR
jgi:hypothetical protein